MIITFKKILEDMLLGKRVCVRKYDDSTNTVVMPHICDNTQKMLPTAWIEKTKYMEWRGKVEIIQCSNDLQFDIIFVRDENHKYPTGKHYPNAYNLDINTHLEIIDHEQ